MSSLIGRTLGQYEITELLGKGGMASVYLARQTSIDRYVAIKVLPPHPGLDEAFKERFQLEAKTIGSLQNPNILPLYDYGADNDILYLVMAYADGGTLDDLIELGQMDIHDVEKILRAVASGLDYAHRKGIIHRDIKPANILLSDGNPLLADFGIVKMSAGGSNLTGTAIVGTPNYMAPEQGQGLEVDARADVYALGAMVYEMLAGKPPFSGDTPMQIIIRHINDPVPDIRTVRSTISSELSAVLTKVLAKNPDERYQSAGEFAQAFSRAVHTNSDTLANIEKQFPIDVGNKSTIHRQQPKTVELPVPDKRATGSTILIREHTNPAILLGGFAILALVIVIIVLVLNGNQNNADPVVIEPTQSNLPTVATFGEVRYSTDVALGDTVNVRLSGVRPATTGNNYFAWLINTDNERVINLGRIILDGFGEGSTVYTDSEGRMLPAYYNAIAISEENTEAPTEPSETIVYRSELPRSVSEGLFQIFVSSPDGLSEGSLLNGAQVEAGFADQHAGLAASATSIGGIRSHSEHTINILRGESVDYNNSGAGENPGRGVGVYAFLDRIDAILEQTTTAENATIDLQENAEYIRICTLNARVWADETIRLEQIMLAGETVEAVQAEATQSTQVMAQLLNGIDANQNGVIQPFEGECGLAQIPSYGLQFARMDIFEATTP